MIADFGAGKTTLLRHIEYERGLAYMEGEDLRIPLFVPLREYRNSMDVLSLIRASFRDAYHRDLPRDLIWSRIESGSFFVLLDAFDEMVERSDAGRRLDLFHQLLPVLRSRCPTILTCRPGYFVECGEFDRLLATLRENEATVSGDRGPGLDPSSEPTDRLARKLIERHREVPPNPTASVGLDQRDVELVRLSALDTVQIREFLETRAEELAVAGTSPAAVMQFIERTYDLADLASRPMLLDLIITSVVIDGLDIEDTSRKYGASGLYEAYVKAKLRHDFAKGRTRQQGLPLDLRLRFSELLAIRMYKANKLEDDFLAMIDELLGEEGPLVDELKASGLTSGEIATDFSTCSFATLEQDAKCRFIHKSFRGFFVARVLKERLKSPRYPLLSDPLEREVLYFLGGFAPTEPRVGEQLWAGFSNSTSDAQVLRSNMLVAYLYTRPDHDTRLIPDAQINAAEFGRLNFAGTRLRNVTWNQSTVKSLEVREAKWRGVMLNDSRFSELTFAGCDVEIDASATVIESLRTAATKTELSISNCMIEFASLRGGNIRLNSSRSTVDRLRLIDATLTWHGVDDYGGELEASNSTLILNAAPIRRLSARRSAIRTHADTAGLADWKLTESVLLLDEMQRYAPEGVSGGGGADRGSLIIAPHGLSPQLVAATKAGVFGALAEWAGPKDFQNPGGAWGVLDAGALLGTKLSLPDGVLGVRVGEVLLVPSEWYQRATSANGVLATVSMVESLANIWEPASTGAAFQERLTELLLTTRSRFQEALQEGSWRELSSL